MDAVTQEKGSPPELHCIREVRVQIPFDRQDDIVRFYTNLLGLTPWPPRGQIPGGVGFGDPFRGLYLQYRHDAQVDPLRRRFTLLAASLEELEQRLGEYRWPYVRGRGLDYTDQWLLLADPVGHLIEVRPLQKLL